MDKTDDNYKNRNETKKAWREVCICLQEDFEALGDVKKTLWVSIATIYLTQLIENKLTFFFNLFILCTLLFIFLTTARK